MTQVIDNFLDEKDFESIQDYLMGSDIPWLKSPVLREGSLHPPDLQDMRDNIQFWHPFYMNDEPKHDDIDILNPIIRKLEVKALLRIKANITMRTPEIIEHGYHTDYPFGGFKTAIFYINTNDGYTQIKNGRRVESVENRLLEFSGELEHTGTTCTDQQCRVVINFDYF